MSFFHETTLCCLHIPYHTFETFNAILEQMLSAYKMYNYINMFLI